MQMNDNLTQRLEASMEALNIRIARLAMALDVSLDDSTEVAALMAMPQAGTVVVERRSGSSSASQVGLTSERRRVHQREELRGLLVLRYHMETTSLNDNGYAVTHQILVEAEQHLVRQGFKPGADGLRLDGFFDGA